MSDYSRRAQARLFFDIETTARPDVESLIGEVSAPRNVKDPVKLAEAVEAKRAEAIEMAALDPDLATVRLISYQVGLGGDPTIILVPTRRVTASRAKLLRLLVPGGRLMVCTEAEAVQKFWEVFSLCGGYCVGYNVLGFDLPFLMRRSMELRVRLGQPPNLAKYRTEPITDLWAVMFNWAWSGTKRLKWLAARYGLEVLAPEVGGGDVATLTDEELITYGLSDLHVTTQLYRLMNGVYYTHQLPELVSG